MAAIEFSQLTLASDANLKAYYKLENVNDSSGAGKTLTNNNTVTFDAAKFNNGANFSSANTNKSLSIADALSYAGGAYSISCWVKVLTELTSNSYWLIQLQESTTDTQFYLQYYYDAGSRYIIFGRNKFGVAGGANYIQYAYTLYGTGFNNLIITYDGITVTGYLNGANVGQIASSGSGSVGIIDQFVIGANDNGSGTKQDFASVQIDDVALFNRALSASEVALINQGPSSAYMRGGKSW